MCIRALKWQEGVTVPVLAARRVGRQEKSAGVVRGAVCFVWVVGQEFWDRLYVSSCSYARRLLFFLIQICCKITARQL